MFDVTLVDHLRLTFGHVVHSYQAHLELAERFSRLVRALRLLQILLTTIAGGSAIAAAMTGLRSYQVAAAAAAASVLVVLILQLTLNDESAAFAHRSAAVRLWLIREKFRALLSDVGDGTVQPVEVRARRDTLMSELHAVYQNVPPTDQRAFERARRALTANASRELNDEDVDRFLPKSLRKTQVNHGV
jgi:hypothetical protein